MFHEYEIVIIVRPDIDDADVKSAVDRIEGTITDVSGHLLERDDWGKRRLAYTIAKHTKGHYTLLRTLVNPSGIEEIERRIRLDDRVIRFGTFKIDESVDVEFLVKQAAERRAEAEAEAERRAAEAAAAAAENEAAADTDNNDND